MPPTNYGAAAGPVVVLMDPENAFGSGEHGSTRAALTLLEALLRPGDRVLDLGSGSGILAIAAARLGAGRAVGVEVDAEANTVAVRNAERNGVAGAFRSGADYIVVGRPIRQAPDPAAAAREMQARIAALFAK